MRAVRRTRRRIAARARLGQRLGQVGEVLDDDADALVLHQPPQRGWGPAATGSPDARYSKALLGSAVSRWAAFRPVLKTAQPTS